MKTVAKIFIIIGMVCQCFLIYPIVLGVIALKKLKTAQKKADFSTAWSVVVLLLVNLIAGIILLCMKDKDFAEGNPPATAA